MTDYTIRRTAESETTTRIHLALSDEKPDVSRLWAPTFGLRIGSVAVTMGGVAGVGTDDEYRRRGYARRVLEDSTRYFAETGHDIAVLFGIPDFYHRFGYAPALPVTTVTVRLQDALDVLAGKDAGGYTARPLEERDWPDALALYDANNAARTGTLLRPRDTWRGYRHGTEWTCQTESYILHDAAGALAGYLTVDAIEEACRVGDLGYATPAVFAALLAEITRQTQRRRQEGFTLKLPPDHPFATFCRACGPTVSTVYERNRGGMARIIGLRSLLMKLAPLLTERARAAGSAEGTLELRTDLGTVVLEHRDGQVSLAESARPTWSVAVPQSILVQLVFGFRSVEDVASETSVNIPSAATPLLDRLFPAGEPWMPIPDWF